MLVLFSELPETLTIVLGTRGSMPILTRVCMQCQADDPKSFEDVVKEELPPISYETGMQPSESGLVEKRTNYTVQCKSCGHTFILQVRSFIDPLNEGCILNHVYELSADGATNYGQLGHFVSLVSDD
jgi:transcription elongation factor Elf1